MFFPFHSHHDSDRLIVEATDASQANQIAEDFTPVYFDGVIKKIDCHCCGDRWRRTFALSGFEDPQEEYGDLEFVGEFSLEDFTNEQWAELPTHSIIIIHADFVCRVWQRRRIER